MSSAKIDAAIAQARAKQPKPVVLAETTVRLTREPIIVKASGELSFSRAATADPGEATLLLFDPSIRAFRPVLMPPGTAWELVQKRHGPNLWRPGMQT